jgi:hypothetical protein
MRKKTTFLTLFLIASTTICNIFSMEENRTPTNNTQPRLNVFAIRGQNGGGSEDWYVDKVLGHDKIKQIPVPNPSLLPDLGQGDCMRQFDKTLKKNSQATGIIHATSQGTATALNYVAEKDQGKQVKGMVLESSLASGNSAINHTVKDGMGMPGLAKLPFFYYWAPYIAKVMFPFYSPSGKQPIKSIAKIPKNMPIIFAHCTRDFQLSYDDSCALYYAARKNGNNNAYLMTKDKYAHVNILVDYSSSELRLDVNDVKAIRSILKKHDLMNSELADPSLDLTPYQPDPEQFKKVHDDLVRKEKNHERLGYAVKAGVALGTIAALKYFVAPVVKGYMSKSNPTA